MEALYIEVCIGTVHFLYGILERHYHRMVRYLFETNVIDLLVASSD